MMHMTIHIDTSMDITLLTHSHSHSLTRSLTHSLTHLLTHSLTHSPLAAHYPEAPYLSQRFELFVHGRELCNGNPPPLQLVLTPLLPLYLLTPLYSPLTPLC